MFRIEAAEVNPGVTPLRNAPITLTPFVGRREECSTLASRLHASDCRLLTITGLGGVGKTRLAVQVAGREAHYFSEGAIFVSLAGITEGFQGVTTVASALELNFSGKDESRQQLLSYLREKQLLLVLDNLEHLPDVGPLLAEIMETAPGVKLLVTSRERVGLAHEWIFPLEGLAVPEESSNANLEDYSAASLFVQSAQRAYPGYSPTPDDRRAIERICRLTEGMPLALELAAAWIRMLPPAEIADELASGLELLQTSNVQEAERHRSIRGAFDHSWRLLSDDERRVFRQLSVFRGGFRTAAAREIMQATLGTLAALVDKSLVRGSPSGRYSIHELLRQFGQERLLEIEDEATTVRDRHSAYYLNFLAERTAGLKDQRQSAYLSEIKTEIDNVREAWLRAVVRNRHDALAQSLDALAFVVEVQGVYQEGIDLFARAIVSAPDRSLLLARLLSRQANLLRVCGDAALSRTTLERSLEIARSVGEQREVAFALNGLANTLIALGDIDAARQAVARSLALYQTLADEEGMARGHYIAGYAEHMAGNFKFALHSYRESALRFRALGDQRSLIQVLTNLGLMLYTQDELAEARSTLEESITLAEQIGYRRFAAIAHDFMGYVMKWGFKDFATARHYYQHSLKLSREIGDEPGIAARLINLGDVATDQFDAGAAEPCYLESLSIYQRLADQRGIAVARLGLGCVGVIRKQYDFALEHFRAALKTFIEIQSSSYIFAVFCSAGWMLEGEGDFELMSALMLLLAHHPNIYHVTRKDAIDLLRKNAANLPCPLDTLLDDRSQAAQFIRARSTALAEKFAVAKGYFDELLASFGESFSSLPTIRLIETLTGREREVLRLLGAGHTNPEIARQLVIGTGTVKTHTLNIYRKLGVSNRTQAVQRARELGLL